MPTYDYQCDACDHKFELYQGINDPKKKKCPQCGQLKLRRLLGTGAAIVFKGSGFYQTDYRSEGYKKAAAAEQSSSETSAGKSGDSAKSGDKSTAGDTAKSSPSSGQAIASSSGNSAASKEGKSKRRGSDGGSSAQK
ncbi:MAG: zinc ribbon domain-containing protein [Pirellulaceae bacterium]|nr:zinc ribbon domain-containing protein [Pirellulaceae bacterium]